MSETTSNTGPVVHRQTIHRQLREVLIAQPWLTSDIEPFHHQTVLTQDYTGRITSRADMITRTALDTIFGDAISLSESNYKTKTATFLDSAEKQALFIDKLKPMMFGSPFKPYHSTRHATDAAATVAHTLSASIHRHVETLKEEPPVLDRELLAARINDFFQSREELAFGLTPSFPMTGAGAAAATKLRAEALTHAVMNVLGEHTKTIPSFKAYLTTMQKPDSKLIGAITEFLNTKSAEYPREMYESKQGLLVADAIGERYAQDLCTHLKKWVVAEHVTVAVAHPKSPGTKALADQIAAKEAAGKGQSAA